MWWNCIECEAVDDEAMFRSMRHFPSQEPQKCHPLPSRPCFQSCHYLRLGRKGILPLPLIPSWWIFYILKVSFHVEIRTKRRASPLRTGTSEQRLARGSTRISLTGVEPSLRPKGGCSLTTIKCGTLVLKSTSEKKMLASMYRTTRVLE